MTASWRRLGALTAQYEKKLDKQLKVFEERHAEELRAVETKYNEQLKAAKGKYSEQLESVENKNAIVLEEKTTLVEELKQHQTTLAKVIETKEKYKESSKINYQEASKLQDDLVISRKEAVGLEERVKELEETNASNLERYKGATFNCFYVFWKHNREADFSYLSERLRQSQIDRCLARLEEEERAKMPASPEISLATGIDGIEEEVEAFVDQQTPQNPPTSYFLLFLLNFKL
ncbi:uncharacterized protein LOC133822984 [Humulus lupulus]|uniref:uncharacterized protein LOC133822984 n=1 Tax=Humulus lupulus TaxID=3486 RepID=UPI002B40FD67|nr:uncharacterized protein LOC133822984 [Humulus lupulus]